MADSSFVVEAQIHLSPQLSLLLNARTNQHERELTHRAFGRPNIMEVYKVPMR